MRISRGTKVIGENLLWCRFVHPISYMAWLGSNIGQQMLLFQVIMVC
jgi:hypothetical protein